jgi:hypothetical protein
VSLQHPSPPAVQALAGNAKLLFTATYNVNDFGNEPLTKDCVPANVGILPGSYSLLYVPFSFFRSTNSEIFINENYQITTFSSSALSTATQYWVINFTNSYPGDTEITAVPVLKFAVGAKNDLYKCVTDVIIDYTNEVRVVYFFQQKKK